MRLEARKFLYDIQYAADLPGEFTGGKTFENYQQEPMLRWAVERGLAIIGEALSQLVKLEPTLVAHISEHRSIIGFRNFPSPRIRRC